MNPDMEDGTYQYLEKSRWDILAATQRVCIWVVLELLPEMLGRCIRGQILKGFKYLAKKSKLNSGRNHEILMALLSDKTHQPSMHSLPIVLVD